MLAPQSEPDLAAMVAEANGPLAVCGGATRAMGAEGAGLTLAQLNGVTLYEPGALTIVAQAGTPLTDIETTLAAEGQRLPFEPTDLRKMLGTQGVPTIGGVVASGASGPRRVQAGACRDSLIGVRFVDGMGTVIKNGGRVMKNVTGYDLVKLMAGSFGTLGILTEVSFKVLPAPEASASLSIAGLDDARAVQALSVALGSPFEVSGAAHLRRGQEGAPETLLRLEGFAQSVVYRCEWLKDLLAEFGEITVTQDPDVLTATWRRVRDVEGFAGEAGDVWRVSVKPSDGPALALGLDRLGAQDLSFDWGGGLVWARMPAGVDARAALTMPGHATLIRAEAETRARLGTFQPEADAVAALARGLRAKFDPRGLLNPGLMG